MKSGADTPLRPHVFAQIPPEVREVIADVLLATTGRDRESPAYDEDQLSRKIRRAAQAEEGFAMAQSGRYPFGGEDSIQADLTPAEWQAWELYSSGENVAEVARRLQVADSTARRLIRRAARRICASQDSSGGISEVYRDEVRRTIYRKPSHCVEQPCRRLGYCKYASLV